MVTKTCSGLVGHCHDLAGYICWTHPVVAIGPAVLESLVDLAIVPDAGAGGGTDVYTDARTVARPEARMGLSPC